MQIARWGNSLAVRIPVDVARTLGLQEGDDVELRALDDGALAVVSDRQRREAALARLTALAIDFPVDYRFDREDANRR